MEVRILDNMPDITGWEWIFEAFTDLTTCRSIGMSMGPIPWTAVQRYAETEQLGRYDAYFLHAAIKHMDGAYLKYSAETQKRNSQAKR